MLLCCGSLIWSCFLYSFISPPFFFPVCNLHCSSGHSVVLCCAGGCLHWYCSCWCVSIRVCADVVHVGILVMEALSPSVFEVEVLCCVVTPNVTKLPPPPFFFLPGDNVLAISSIFSI